MADYLCLGRPLRGWVVAACVGLGVVLVLVPLVGTGGRVSVFGVTGSVTIDGALSVSGILLTVGLVLIGFLALSAARDRFTEWFERRGWQSRVPIVVLVAITPAVVINLIDVHVITSKTMFAGLGISILVLTLANVVIAQWVRVGEPDTGA